MREQLRSDWSEPAAGGAAHAPGGCANCFHCTPFGNCAIPVAAGLSADFELRAHPVGGFGCPVQAPRHVTEGVAFWRIWHGDRFQDLASCPPACLHQVRRDHPHATRIEPLCAEDAWPDAA